MLQMLGKIILQFGAYHFARFKNVQEATQEADFFLNAIAGLPLNYPVALDLEVRNGLSNEVLIASSIAFINKVKDAGYSVLFYANENFYLNYINESRLGDVLFWVAKYSTNFPRVHTDIWQHTSSGKAKGISR